MQEFNIAGLIFICLLEVCNRITINYIINDCINMHQDQDKIQIFSSVAARKLFNLMLPFII